MSVRIRMQRLGRKHRPFYRIVAIDRRQARNGRTLEELGTYDPMVVDKENRVRFNAERVKYWLGVGAQASEKVEVMIKKYMKKMEDAAKAAAVPPAQAEEAPAEASSQA